MIKLESKNPSGQCHVVFPKDCIYTFKAKLVPHADLIIADPPYYKVVGYDDNGELGVSRQRLDWVND